MRQRYDSIHAPPPSLSVGDWDWLELYDGYSLPHSLAPLLPHSLTPSLPHSLLPPDLRPGVQRVDSYPIKRVVSTPAYELDLPSSSRLHSVLSIQHLEPYISSDKPITSATITAILKERRTRRRGRQYLVRFDHAGHDKWVPESTVTNPAVLDRP